MSYNNANSGSYNIDDKNQKRTELGITAIFISHFNLN